MLITHTTDFIHRTATIGNGIHGGPCHYTELTFRSAAATPRAAREMLALPCAGCHSCGVKSLLFWRLFCCALTVRNSRVLIVEDSIHLDGQTVDKIAPKTWTSRNICLEVSIWISPRLTNDLRFNIRSNDVRWFWLIVENVQIIFDSSLAADSTVSLNTDFLESLNLYHLPMKVFSQGRWYDHTLYVWIVTEPLVYREGRKTVAAWLGQKYKQ